MHVTATSRPRREWWLLAGITLAALALRLWAIGDKGLAYDEAATALMARATAGEIIAFHWNAGFEHPPLWQLTMAAWSALFGQSEATLRLLPALMGALAVPLAWLWVRRMWPGARALRLWTAALMALSPVLLLYSQEARMYTVVLVLALLSLIALCALVTRPRGWAIAGFVTANWLMTGFHYYSVLLIGVEGLFLLLLAGRARSWRGVLAGAAITLLSLTPIALWMLLAPGFRATAGVVAGTIGAGATPPALHFLDGLWRDLSFGAIRWQPEIAVTGLLLIPLILLGLAALTSPTSPDPRRDRESELPWGWLVGLLAIMPLAISAALFRSLAARYILFILPAIYVLVAAGIVRLGRWNRWLGVAGAGLALVPAVLGIQVYFGPYVKSEYRAMAAFLAANRQPDEAIMLYAPRQHLLAKYYLPAVTGFATAPAVELPPYWPINAPPVVPEEMDGVIQELLAAHPALWLVVTAEDEVDAGEFVPKYLTAVAYKESCWEWLDVDLCRFLSPRFLTPDATAALDAHFGDELVLTGASIMSPPKNALDRSHLFVQLDWLAAQKPTLDYRVTLRLVDNGGAAVAQRDEFPIGTLLPPTTWNAGDAKPGYMALTLADDLASGDYRVVVGLYDPSTGTPIGEFVTVGEISLP